MPVCVDDLGPLEVAPEDRGQREPVGEKEIRHTRHRDIEIHRIDPAAKHTGRDAPLQRSGDQLDQWRIGFAGTCTGRRLQLAI